MQAQCIIPICVSKAGNVIDVVMPAAFGPVLSEHIKAVGDVPRIKPEALSTCGCPARRLLPTGVRERSPRTYDGLRGR